MFVDLNDGVSGRLAADLTNPLDRDPGTRQDVYEKLAVIANAAKMRNFSTSSSGRQRLIQTFAAWTNLAETTFLLPPTDSAADYKLRIFSPGREMLFAGHPTLGSCAAWLHVGVSQSKKDWSGRSVELVLSISMLAVDNMHSSHHRQKLGPGQKKIFWRLRKR